MTVNATVYFELAGKKVILSFNPYDLTQPKSVDYISGAGFDLVDGNYKARPACPLRFQVDDVIKKAEDVKQSLKWGLSAELKKLIYWAHYDEINKLLTLAIKDQFHMHQKISCEEFEGWLVAELKANKIAVKFAIDLHQPRVLNPRYRVNLNATDY